jgi:ABC-type transport system substrate-binding protein
VNFPDKPLPTGLRLAPEVAAGYTVSRDRRTYAFTIRKGLRFSTGAPVTAQDFAASINRVLNPELKAPPVEQEPFLGIAGARQVVDGNARIAAGITVRRGELVIRLSKREPDFLNAMRFCVLPAGLAKSAVNPEGLRAPVPSAGPYFISEYIRDERLVLERNRFYRGTRPHHVDRFDVTFDTLNNLALLDQVERGQLDYAFTPGGAIGSRARALRSKYGRNRGQFWVESSPFLRMFVLNTARPLFRNNPKLRQAVNFAVDRAALVREHGGGVAVTATDQYLMPVKLGFRDERIYPLRSPDLRKARELARGRRRAGKGVIYVIDAIPQIVRAQLLQRNLKAIGLDLEVRPFPGPVYFTKLATPGEPFDIALVGLELLGRDPGSLLEALFDGRTIRNASRFSNYSYFNSAKYNRLLDRASALTGEERYRAYGELDVQISRDAAPAIPYAYDNALTLVSARTGCVIVNPYLDLAAVCLR